MSSEEFSKLQEYDKLCEVIDVTVHPADGNQPVEVKTLTQGKPDQFTYPCWGLVEACAKCDKTFYYLQNDQGEKGLSTYIEVEVIDATSEQS